MSALKSRNGIHAPIEMGYRRQLCLWQGSVCRTKQGRGESRWWIGWGCEMRRNWDRQGDETEEWYDRFVLYLYMGPDRSISAAHTFATRLAKGATHGSLTTWRRVAQRNQWQARAGAFDAVLARKAYNSDERMRMVAELLSQVYGVLRQAELLTMTKEEARQLLPTFRLFFRDLLRLHQSESVQRQSAGEGMGGPINADDMMQLLTDQNAVQAILADLRRVTETPNTESAWRPLRDVLAQFYPDESSARRIAAQAYLDSARIHFSARAVDSWHAILTEAAHAGRMEGVIQAVEQEYGANGELAKAVLHYRQAHGLQTELAQPAKQKRTGRKG